MNDITRDDLQTTVGHAVKSLGGGRVGGYLVYFTGPDRKDLSGEYFTRQTDFGTTPTKGTIALYHHALDGTVGGTQIGVVDTVKVDEEGIWIEAQLDAHNEYTRRIDALVTRGVLSWSSGAHPKSVLYGTDGHIKRWYIVEASLTPTPAEPFGTRITSIKSLGNPTPFEALWGKETDEGDRETDSALKSDTSAQEGQTMAVKNSAAIIEAVAGQFPEATADQIAAIVAAVEGGMSAEVEAVDAASADELAMDAYDEDKATEVQKAAARIARYAGQQFRTETAKRFAGFGKVGAQAPVNAGSVKNAGSASGNGTNKAAQSAPWAESRQAPNVVQDLAMKSRVARIRPEVASLIADVERMLNPRLESIKYDNPAQRGYLYQHVADYALERAEKGGMALTEDQARGFSAIKSIKADELDNVGQSNYGAEFVPTVWTSQFWDHAFGVNTVAPHVNSFPMTDSVMVRPVRGTRGTVYYVPEPTDDADGDWSGSTITSSKLGTANKTWTAKELGIRIPFSTKLEMASIIDWANFAVNTAQNDFLRAVDHVILMGDNASSGNINYDGDTAPTTAQYMIFDGIALDGLANGIDGGGVAVTIDQLRQLRFKLNREFSSDLPSIRLFTGPEGYARLLNLDEFATADKQGDVGSTRNGVVGEIFGMQVVNTPVLLMSAADGKITYNAAGTLARYIAAYTPSYEVGYWQQIQTYPATSPDGRVKQITLNAFMDMQNSGQTLRAAMLYNSLA